MIHPIYLWLQSRFVRINNEEAAESISAVRIHGDLSSTRFANHFCIYRLLVLTEKKYTAHFRCARDITGLLRNNAQIISVGRFFFHSAYVYRCVRVRIDTSVSNNVCFAFTPSHLHYAVLYRSNFFA